MNPLDLLFNLLMGTPVANIAIELKRALADGRLTFEEDLGLGVTVADFLEKTFPQYEDEIDLVKKVAVAVEEYVIAHNAKVAAEAQRVKDATVPHGTTFPPGTPGKDLPAPGPAVPVPAPPAAPAPPAMPPVDVPVTRRTLPDGTHQVKLGDGSWVNEVSPGDPLGLGGR